MAMAAPKEPVPTTYESVGVDTPEDVARAERILTQVPSHSGLRRTSSRGADQEGIQIKNLNTWCIKKKGWMRPFA